MSHHIITVTLTIFLRQHVMVDQMFLAPSAPSAGSDWQDMIEQPLSFTKCQRQHRIALCPRGHHLKTLFLWTNSHSLHRSMMSHQTITALQTEILKQRMCNQPAGLLTILRESQLLSLLPHLVRANVGGLAGCYEEWPSKWPKVCTTWYFNIP